MMDRQALNHWPSMGWQPQQYIPATPRSSKPTNVALNPTTHPNHHVKTSLQARQTSLTQ